MATAVRKNALLDLEALERYVQACVELKKKKVPDRNGDQVSVFDQFVGIHLGVTLTRRKGTERLIDGAHGNAGFLPWHREYLIRFERALQDVAIEKGIINSRQQLGIPYWDWSRPDDLFKSDRIGPDGRPTTGEMSRGPFTPSKWPVLPELDGPSLTRFLGQGGGFLPSVDQVGGVMGRDRFEEFRPELEVLHGAVHIWINGSMARMTSPNDPIFFMHHSNVDRIWAQWQNTGHVGEAFYAQDRHSNTGAEVAYGHKLNDRMWPWDGGQADFEVSDTVATRIRRLVPVVEAGDIRCPSDVLEYTEENLGYRYDDVDPGECEFMASHRVVPGDRLIQLAREYYGSGDRDKWMLIYNANKDVIGDNPALIRPGQILKIPKLPTA